MELQELINVSGDSYLKMYRYEAGIAEVELEMDELDRQVILSIKTDIMSFDVPESEDIPHRTCFIELVNVSELLATQHGIYVPPLDFGKVMQEKRQNLNLAYGLREAEYMYMLSLSAGYKLASFVIKNIEAVSFRFLED